MLNDFIQTIKNGMMTSVSGEDGFVALRVAYAAVDSMEVLKPVEMEKYREG